MNGVINVYKELGYTSHDVVAKLRGILKMKKIGHTGTLDPQAEGVLPVCLGSATKLCDMLTDKTKEYEAVMQLGVVTDTQDMTGTVLSQHTVDVDEDGIAEIMSAFVGKIEQIPPMYSALKVNGKKLYELAREGREVERSARPIEIYDLEILQMSLPLVRFRVSCSKGTYIRTLCHDIGEKAGCGGCMKSLKRTRVGRFLAEDALTLSKIEGLRDEGRVGEVVVAVEDMFDSYPKVTILNAYRKVIDNGNIIERKMMADHDFITQMPKQPQPAQSPDMSRAMQPAQSPETLQPAQPSDEKKQERIRVYNEDGVFYGIYERAGGHRYKPYKMFLDKEQLRNC